MNEMERRVKNLEAKADEKRGKHVAYCWIEPDEDEDAALVKWKEENGGEDPDLEVFIVSWASETTWPPQGQRASELKIQPSVDEQIDQILGELQGEGYSLEQIATMVKEESPVIPEPERAPQPEEARPAKGQSIEPLKAGDLVKLFGRRR